ncbi:MAG: prepilin-type N-terminal cleavage/methylation domain-containing protein [Gammaproteobacteria bacterium]|nr:prepilin-type N-terminal cleavage/methylation domain-containing protein [Gammaproteobacteria bacterium]
MKKAQGFTLIELVIVIIILGILAVTAAPKFIDISSDAKAATLQGVKASLEGAKTLIYAKAAVNGSERKDATTVSVNGTDINIVYGYPKAAKADFLNILEISEVDFTIEDGTKLAYIFPEGVRSPTEGTNPGTCYVKYEEATVDSTGKIFTAAKVTTKTDGC